MPVLNCIAYEHNRLLVLLSIVICCIGVWVTLRLLQRASQRAGKQQAGWIFLAAVAGGSSIWCTHFIAMLAFESPVAIRFEPILTIVSLFAAIAGSAIGFYVAVNNRNIPEVGGAIVGVGISSMHYLGMRAYHVDGLLFWEPSYVTLSWVISLSVSAIALGQFIRQPYRYSGFVSGALLVLAVVGLHFTGMTAVTVVPTDASGGATDPAILMAMAFAVAGGTFMIASAGIVSHLIDNEVVKENIEQLRYLAHFDGLTALPNRSAFTQHLAGELQRAEMDGDQVAVIGLDLNRFKEINDLRGHRVGDQVLTVIGRRLAALCQEGEFIARIGGDEFSAVKRYADQANLLGFVDRIESDVVKPISIDGALLGVGASIGVSVFPQDGANAETLINNADLAMYRAKADVTQSVCFYEQQMDEAARFRHKLSVDLRNAVAGRQLELHYQPQLSVETGAVIGYEALLRWQHPDHGLVSPLEFIPLAEANGLIVEIGEWVLRMACREAASWIEPFKIAVNISPVQFANSDLAHLVENILVETGLDPGRLELEITESTVIADKAMALRTLRAIRALGATIAIDDFGTGYSSLDTLRSFPFDRIKLDRSFMTEAERSPEARAIIRAVLALGKSLHVSVLAEGVESSAQLNLLRADGCDEAQGFYLGRPKPVSEMPHRSELHSLKRPRLQRAG